MTTQEKHSGPTCKTCGFYENSCPFIRGKFIPYPSRVCKDYTDSTIEPADREIWDTKHGYKGVEFKILEEL